MAPEVLQSTRQDRRPHLASACHEHFPCAPFHGLPYLDRGIAAEIEFRDAEPARLRERGEAGIEPPPNSSQNSRGVALVRCSIAARLPGANFEVSVLPPSPPIVRNGHRRWVLFCRRIGRPVVRVTRIREKARRPALLTCLSHVCRGGPRHESYQQQWKRAAVGGRGSESSVRFAEGGNGAGRGQAEAAPFGRECLVAAIPDLPARDRGGRGTAGPCGAAPGRQRRPTRSRRGF